MAVRFLHISKDDKFFDSTIRTFKADIRLANSAVIVKGDNNIQLQYVNETENVLVLDIKKLRPIIKKGVYDVIFFHSISEEMWKVLNWIPKTKVIIWWAWGYDLYLSRIPFFKPLINIPLYKHFTKQYKDFFTEKKAISLPKKFTTFLIAIYYNYCRKKNLKRIDYFIPVIHSEYEILAERTDFIAKELYLNFSVPKNKVFEYNHNIDSKKVLIGNSAFPTNNHIDIWRKMKDIAVIGKQIILPLNYGYPEYRDFLEHQIVSDTNEITILRDFLPVKDYMDLLGSCAFAVFGIIRQQAMGNIFGCLWRGIKVFLYEDSLVYKYLKKEGFIVYSIDSMTENDFVKPLSYEEARHNFETLIKVRIRQQELYNRVISEISEHYE